MKNTLSVLMDNFSEDEIINLFVSATPVAYVIMDREFRIHFINDYFTELRQLDKATALGDKCYNLSNGGVRCSLCPVHDSRVSGKKQKVFRKDYLPSGTIRCIEEFAVPLMKNKEGDFDYILEIMINRDEEMMKRKQRDDDFMEIIYVLSSLLEAKDTYTAEHSRMVGQLSVRTAKIMQLPEEDIFEIDMAANLHDIGKVFIPNDIINKTGKLTEEEYKLIQTHPSKSRGLLDSITGFQRVKDYVLFHHERIDKKGYPLGLAGDQIPLGAKIISVADAYEAMTSRRSYRQAITHDEALQRIIANSGTQFDPMVVEAFLKIFDTETEEETLLPKNSQNNFEGIVREITVEPETKRKTFKELHDIMPQTDFIKAIFDHAPVGYLILDVNYEIIFANDYFINLTGENIRDRQKIRKCYEFTGKQKKCENCTGDQAILTGKMQNTRRRWVTQKGVKYFDIFILPLTSKNEDKYLAEILIDRTEETMLEIQHEKDMSTLVKVLSGLLNEMLYAESKKSLREVAVNIAHLIKLPEEAIKNLEIAADLCNIGMISMGADGIILEEEEMYKMHASKSCEILNKLSGYEKIKIIIRHHHEHYDGSGFPDRLSGENIPLESRIIAIAEKITTENLEWEKSTVSSLLPMAGTIFDPHILKILDEQL